MTQRETLTEQELTVAQAMLDGCSVREIAALIGYSHTGAHCIMRRPHVAAWVAECQREAQDAVRRAIVRAAPEAVRVLRSIATDDDAAPSSRVAAASKLVDMSVPRQSSVELTGRGGGALRVEIGPDTPDDVLERLAAAED
jgi:IS30 family transposase